MAYRKPWEDGGDSVHYCVDGFACLLLCHTLQFRKRRDERLSFSRTLVAGVHATQLFTLLCHFLLVRGVAVRLRAE